MHFLWNSLYSIILFPGYSLPSTNVTLWVQTVLHSLKPSFCTFNSLIESSKCTSWRRFTFCAEIGGYVNISGRSMWIIRWWRDKVHNKCLTLLYVSKQKSKAQWTSVALPWEEGGGVHRLQEHIPSVAPMTSLILTYAYATGRSLSLRNTESFTEEANFIHIQLKENDWKWLKKWETPLWVAFAQREK